MKLTALERLQIRMALTATAEAGKAGGLRTGAMILRGLARQGEAISTSALFTAADALAQEADRIEIAVGKAQGAIGKVLGVKLDTDPPINPIKLQ